MGDEHGNSTVSFGDDNDDPDNDLWESRPELAHIREFSRARLCAPFAVLGNVLMRVGASIPANVVLPPIVGGVGTLNHSVALVGASGSGKGASERCAEDAVKLDNELNFKTAGIGSGEGVLHQYVSRNKDDLQQHTESVLFTVPEVDTLAAMHQRNSSTTLSVLRQAWSGETLSFAYVATEKRLTVESGTYRLMLVVGVQPAKGGALLDAVDGGTPQRFLWLPTTDPYLPDTPPAEPAPLRWGWDRNKWGIRSETIPVCAEATTLIQSTQRQKLSTGKADLDGHALYARLKVAALLGILNGRLEVSANDWQLAGRLMEVSDRTRDSVQRELAAAARKVNTARAKGEGHRAVVAAGVVAANGLKLAGGSITRKLERAGGWVPGHVARKAVSADFRRYFDDAVESLAATGVIEVEEVHETGKGKRLRMAVKT